MVVPCESDGTEKKMVLIVDDEPDMLRSLGRFLRSKGLRVETASNGEEAIDRARELSPNAIVMDIKMPGMNGLEASIRIRDIQSNIYVVLMTGFSEYFEEAQRTEGIDVLEKPIDPAMVCTMITSSA